MKTFQILEGKRFQHKTLYPAKPSIKYESKLKTLLDVQKLKKFLPLYFENVTWNMAFCQNKTDIC